MRISESTVKKVFIWCKGNFGESEFHDTYPKLAISDVTEYLLGEFDDENNILYVNVKKHENLMDLIATVIHEYVHYLQNTYEHYDRLYNEYVIDENADYYKNPFEEEARRISFQSCYPCYMAINNIK